MRLAMVLLALAWLTVGRPAVAEEEPVEVRYPMPPKPFGLMWDYFSQVLDLALSKTAAEFGPYRLAPKEIRASNPRLDNLLDEGIEFNVLLATPNRERDSRFIPVRIPLDKGILGYRVLMIRQGDADRFASVKSVDDLRQIPLGQGLDWEDTYILAASGFKVDGGSNYTSLLDMLLAERFHGFPRGIYEIDNEMDFYASAGKAAVQAEPKLMLHYQTTRIIYVSRRDQDLAKRFETGLRMALADGSFDRLLTTHPTMVRALRRANFGQRVILEIPNPRIPPDFPLDDPGLWFKPPS